MRARACIKCREFVLVRPEDPQNLILLKEFENNHVLHTIITVDYNEIKGSYSNFAKKLKNNTTTDETSEFSAEKQLKGTS
jgi:hypothetical protein